MTCEKKQSDLALEFSCMAILRESRDKVQVVIRP